MAMKDAFGAGLRGHEKPKEKAKPKRSVKRVTVEPASNGGHIVTVEHHEKKSKGPNAPSSYREPEKHAHSSHQEAHAHVGELMHNMSTPEEYDGGEE